MVWPATNVNTTNADAGTDSPTAFRSDVLDLINKFNQLRAHPSPFIQGLLDDINAATARATLGAASAADLVDAANPDKGAGAVGFNTALAYAAGTSGRQLQRADGIINPREYAAVGDGTTDDSAAFTAIEAAFAGRTVDLQGKSYLVTTVPRKNLYVNGKFVSGSMTRTSLTPYVRQAPRFHPYGGQLRKLRESLNNPFEQITGICLIGDSITWGSTLPENAISTPRTGVLADPRDVFATPSWANELKRHIGAAYFEGATPTLTNWSGSASGEAIATYTKNVDLYTAGEGFTYTALSGTSSRARFTTPGALLGYRDGVAVNSDGVGAVDFTFTGDSFTVYYTCVTPVNGNASYELIVDGVSQGNFNCASGVPGTNQNTFTHTFGYVRNKTVRLRVFWNAGGAVTQTVHFEGIRVPKKCIITNQGIIGATSRSYNAFNLPTAVAAHDNYVLCMLGTNDRIKTASPAATDLPNDILSMRDRLKAVRTAIVSLADIIFMCANPATENPSIYGFTQQMARSVIDKLAKENSHDFIDNYIIFNGTSLATVTADNLHPNEFGHQMIAANVIGALEAA